MKLFRAIFPFVVILTLSACSQETPEPTTRPSPTKTAVPTMPTATAEPAPPAFEAGDCPFEVPAGAPVECGFVTVPADHDNLQSGMLRLAVTIVRDSSDDHQPDPVIVLAGGPGEKVVANSIPLAQIFFPTIINRDLVIFDQRGVGLSEPVLECPEWQQSILETLDQPDPEQAASANLEALVACSTRLESEGIDLSRYTNLQNAADVDALRSALGYEQINLYGGSYGSHLAQHVAREYPETIRSMVLWSVWPLENSLFVEGTTATASAVLHMLDSCESDAVCSSAYPDLRQVLFETIDRLNAEPISIVITQPLDGQRYAASLSGDGVYGNLVALLYQTQLIPALPQAIYDVYNRDYGLIEQLIGQNLTLYGAMSRGMTYSVVCADDLIGRTPEEVWEARTSLPEPLQGRMGYESSTKYGVFGICDGWPVEQSDPSVKQPLSSDIPTLMLEGEFDPVTPVSYARLVAEQLTNSYLYEFPGIGHNILVASECARQLAAGFVDDPSQAPDTSCLEELSGISFDVPGDKGDLALVPFEDEQRGFTGLVPQGWEELAPANLKRSQTALDPVYFVLEAAPVPAADMLVVLASQLGFDAGLSPVSSGELGSFVWDFYQLERGGNPTDLALAEEGGKAYFVLMVSPPDEHDELYGTLFLPAVEAMAPIG